MGNKLVTFTEEQLNDYQDCTFFTRKEILRVHKKFRELQPDLVPRTMTKDDAVHVRVARDIMERLPELRENPFKSRICEVFSSDGKGNLSFEDFLDMLSILNEHAPRDIKVYYAFKIYDFDNDQFLGPSDLQQTLRLLTQSQLLPEEMTQVCEKVVDECDVDADGRLSYMEFEHVITRAPDFLSTFHIRI
ncbi:calcium and integrin-binding family member 2 [Thrips palmi]|uniref:Calcium and integrin-binding family member 2 n=1 Tax=Thrips palmi TaxID=161013 RepID=A0A6P8ZCC2_THRPL|nr:calcium and integrin-binding family member 2 [Thrips palmi]XP_034246210.1 calcium and integrin-binding family member 2 [Thrips palmi]XP_034246212.1 calcium and integrin-binding family member 2 [Thrips palmi]XP_034246213.1 calcium and integrin-binding family member 2 [Thrips palmi]